jgi:hypothetical protein
MVERQLPKLHTRVRFPSPAVRFGWALGVFHFRKANVEVPYQRQANLFLTLMRFYINGQGIEGLFSIRS